MRQPVGVCTISFQLPQAPLELLQVPTVGEEEKDIPILHYGAVDAGNRSLTLTQDTDCLMDFAMEHCCRVASSALALWR